MSKNWRKYVSREYMNTDNDFVDSLPFKSIDAGTFGLITEATTFAPVETEEGGVHIKPVTKGLRDLKDALQDSSDPRKNFDVSEAEECLEEFAREWEENIKGHKKWDKMVEIARDNEEILNEEEIQTSKGGKSIFGRIFNFFR